MFSWHCAWRATRITSAYAHGWTSWQMETAFASAAPRSQILLRLLTVKEWLKEDVCTNEAAITVYGQVCIHERVGFVVEEASGIEDFWLKLASLPEKR